MTGSGYGPSPSLNHFGQLATVTVAPGQDVHVTAMKVLGTMGNNPPADVEAWLCHRPAGTPASEITVVGDRVHLILSERDRVPLAMSGVLSGLPAGEHWVGMCGRSDNFSEWNDNGTSYVTALVFDSP